MGGLGFFNSKPKKMNSSSKVYDCDRCGLHRTCNTPKMDYSGDGERGILIVADQPSEAEDFRGKHLRGSGTMLLQEELNKYGISLDKDCWKINSINCHTKQEIKEVHIRSCYNEKVLPTIKELKPKYIWILGGNAIKSVYRDALEVASIDTFRGLSLHDQVHKAITSFMYHPNYILKNNNDHNLRAKYELDIRAAVETLDEKFRETERPEENLTLLTEFDGVVSKLKYLINNPPEYLAFDYETSGLKPFKNWIHKIWTVAYSYDENNTYAFPIHYPLFNELKQKRILSLWRKVLNNSSKKIAHNLQFEKLWSKYIVGTDGNNWFWDTRIAAHLLNNVEGIYGLKTQSALSSGHYGYDDYMKPFLKPPKGQEINIVPQAQLEECLIYNGGDAKETLGLYFHQNANTYDGFDEAFEIFNEGNEELLDVQCHGFTIDVEHFKRESAKVAERIIELEDELVNGKEGQLFFQQTGSKIKIPKSGSSNDLKTMVFDVLGMTPYSYTDKGEPALDKEAFQNMNHPFLDKILEMRKLIKVKDTYIKNILKEVVEYEIEVEEWVYE